MELSVTATVRVVLVAEVVIPVPPATVTAKAAGQTETGQNR